MYPLSVVSFHEAFLDRLSPVDGGVKTKPTKFGRNILMLTIPWIVYFGLRAVWQISSLPPFGEIRPPRVCFLQSPCRRLRQQADLCRLPGRVRMGRDPRFRSGFSNHPRQKIESARSPPPDFLLFNFQLYFPPQIQRILPTKHSETWANER